MGEISAFHFYDENNRAWDMRVTGGTIKRVQQMMKINLLDMMSFKRTAAGGLRCELMDRFASDPVFMVDLLWAVCMPQAVAAGVSETQFAELLAGDVIEHACNALMEAVVNFTPNPAAREAIRQMWTIVQSAGEAVEQEMMAAAKKMEAPEMKEAAKAAVRAHIASSSSAAASAESTPTE